MGPATHLSHTRYAPSDSGRLLRFEISLCVSSTPRCCAQTVFSLLRAVFTNAAYSNPLSYQPPWMLYHSSLLLLQGSSTTVGRCIRAWRGFSCAMSATALTWATYRYATGHRWILLDTFAAAFGDRH